MICHNCGSDIPSYSEKCPDCGARVIHGNQNVSTPVGEQYPLQRQTFQLPIPAAVAIIVIFIVGALVIFPRLLGAGTNDTLTQGNGEWHDYDNGIIRVLDFDKEDKTITYRLEVIGYSWLDSDIATFDYKVVGPNKIKVKMKADDYRVYKLKFDDEKEYMTITPALTSTDSSESFYKD